MLKFVRSLFTKNDDHTLVDGFPVPAAKLRLCGKAIQDNAAYVETARKDASRLVEKCGCKAGTAVLDIGCGHGRLLVGLLSTVPDARYMGLDVVPDTIAWCKRNFRRWPNYRFAHLDVLNERYHRDGSKLSETYQIPVPEASWDIIFLFSVFSHMDERDMRIYLKDFPRLLRPNGHVLFTTFVEEDVPPFSVNPDGYIFEKCSGPLHIVRFERSHLFKIIEECGFRVVHFGHRTELDHQSVLILTPR